MSFWAIFCPNSAPSPNNLENQNFEKLKKASRDVIILHMCTKNDNHMMLCFLRYEVWQTEFRGGGWVGLSKNWVTWGVGVWDLLLERGDKLVKGVWCRNGGGCHFFLLLYSSVQSHLHFWIFSLWVSHARFSSTFSSKSCTKTWYHLYISDPFW